MSDGYLLQSDVNKMDQVLLWRPQLRLHYFSISMFINPRLTKPFFVTRLTKGGGMLQPDFPNRTPYEIDFGINR